MHFVVLIVISCCLAVCFTGRSSSAGPQPLALIAANKEPLVLTIASFAVTKLAYVRLTKLFRDRYLSEKGVDVRFRLTFAGSGVQVGGCSCLVSYEGTGCRLWSLQH